MRKYLRLLEYARRQRGALVFIFALTVFAAGLMALQPLPMKLLFDQVLGKAPVPSVLADALRVFSLEPSPATLLALSVVGGLVLFALNSAVETGLTWAWTIAGRRVVYDLAQDLFARLQRRSVLYHKRQAVGDTMGRVTVDSWCIYRVVDTLLFSPLHALLGIAGMVWVMAQIDVTLTLLSLAVAPFMVGASFFLGKPLRAAAKLRREVESRIQAHIQQTLTGIPVVQAFAQEERESARFRSYADTVIRSQQFSALLGSVNGLGSGLVATLGSGVILWVGARHVLAGQTGIGTLLAFLVYVNSLQAQIKVFAGLYTTLQDVSASVQRVMEVLDGAPDLPEKPNAEKLGGIKGQVVFEKVSTGYTPGQPVLREVSFRAMPGQTVAIVGATGAGKTTLINLIPRFADVWEGRVLVDGRDVRDVTLQSLRRQVAVVLQESMLFPISIAENIAYGRPEASRAEIEAAARAANAHEFIAALSEGYDTVIGERGATLSGGERQRLAIARAILRNPPILILDEPTSALDAETERLILDALERLMKGRTTFVIAHRLSTVRRADQIVVLKDGRIVEGGTHEELLARQGDYAHLHRIQTGVTREPVAAG